MANTKRRALSLLLAVMMILTAVPMNAIALDWSDLATQVCTKEEVGHTEECYKHTEDCYHKHGEPVYVMGKLILGCAYDCAEHTHSAEKGCPVANCDAHAHTASCCGKEKHEHGVLCYKTEQVCSHGWQVWKCNDSCYETYLSCTKTVHTHSGTDCSYTCGISTEHTHDADCYTCEIAEHTHDENCTRLCGMSTTDIDPIKCNNVTLYLHEVDCKNEEHHKHGAACYLPAEVISDAFRQATGVEIQSAEEIGAVIGVLLSCKTGCKLDYDVLAVEPYFEVSLILCEQHFCAVCHRLNGSYCDCVEITFANIGNSAENTKTVKVKAGETVDADEVPNADLINFRFLGWFDAEGNEFSTETVYAEDVTFTAQYKALTEAEKLENALNFVKNNLNLGAELGRMITILSKGAITKDTVLENKDALIEAVELYLLTNQLTGKITPEQAAEIVALMKQGDEHTNMFAEWLWAEDAVLMPEIDEVIAGIDFAKLAEEIKDMIAAEYGIDLDENWIDNNRAQAEEYISSALEQVKTLTEEQKKIVLDQIANQKERAASILAMIRCEIACSIKSEIENAVDLAEEAVNQLLADTALGIKIGKNISRLTGLNHDSAMERGSELKDALIAALGLSNLTEAQQEALINALNNNDGIVVEFINWLWPQTSVLWMNGDKLLEEDIIAIDEKAAYDGETPVKEGNDEYTYIFAGWEKTEEDGRVIYKAVFDTEINEYTIIWMNGETVLATESVPYGTTPEFKGETPVKDGNDQYSYTFAGWDKEVVAVTGDAAYTATFTETVNTYVITFVVDGVETTATYAYGAMPEHADPTKAADAEYTYKFTGWDKEFAPVTGNETYTAAFEAIPVIYTVTWMVNGEAVETDSVTYGTMPEYNGAEPAVDGNAQYTYTFTGWDKEIVAVTGDVTYTALFDCAVNEYTITFVNDDGTVLETQTVAYGETPVYGGATPYKADTAEFYYDFAGFGEIVAVTGDATYTAQYTATVCTYRVTFVDGGKTLSSMIYAYGDTIVAPELPTKKGWESKWSCEFSTVTGELTVEVVWSPEVFGTHDLLVYIGWGESATDSNKNWFSAGKGKIFNARSYYSYYVDGKYTGSTEMIQGADYGSYSANLGNISIGGITYGNGTGSDFYVVNEYVVVATSAQYHLDCHATLYHTVTFVDYNGNVIDTVTVQRGETASAPEASRKGYVFTGWDQDITAVTESMEVVAQYEYEYVESARLKINVGNGTPASGSTKGNALSHWGTIYNARSVYSYYDYPNYKGDSVMSNDDFDYDRTSSEAIPGDVTYGGVVYTNGEGSSDNYYVLLNDGVYVACRGEYHLDYKASFYNVYTYVVDGVETKVTALQGTDPVAPADPVKAGYEFDGWEIDENGVYNAKFTKTHTVTFAKPTGGTVKVYVRDGDLLEEYIPKAAAGERFLYWYNSQDGAKLDYSQPITCNMSFSAKCQWIIEDHEVTLMGVLNGKNYNLGMAVFTDSYHARKYSNKWLTADQYDPAKIILPDTLNDITFDGVTYTYGNGDNYYTVNFNALDSHMEKGYHYRYYGDVELFHNNVTVWLNSRKITMDDVAHGTVIDNNWLAANGYLSFVVVEEVVINQSGEYHVACEAK